MTALSAWVGWANLAMYAAIGVVALFWPAPDATHRGVKRFLVAVLVAYVLRSAWAVHP